MHPQEEVRQAGNAERSPGNRGDQIPDPRKGLVSCPTLNQLQLRGNEVASAAMASLTHALVEQEKKSFIRDDITLGIQVLPCSGL